MESPGIISFLHDPKNRRLLHVSWTATTIKDRHYVVHLEESTGYKADLNLPAAHAYFEHAVNKEGCIKVSVAVCDTEGIIGTPSKAEYNFSVSPNPPRNLRAKVSGTNLFVAWDAPEDEEDAKDIRYKFMVRYATGPDFGQTLIEQTTQSCSRTIKLPKDGVLEVSVAAQRMSRWYGAEDTSNRGVEINDGQLVKVLINTVKDNIIQKSN